ncbi:MAG: S9 family peptidase [Nanoarchaeota archaeon]|nr:S9 family peptidase [Nanoarchaeota archaeon]
MVLKYPFTEKIDVIDDYFGVKIVDSYSWLEDLNSKKVKNWIELQANFAQDFVNKFALKDKIKKDLNEIWNYKKYSIPFKEGNYFYYFKNDGLQNQAVLWRKKNLENDEGAQVVLDPNSMNENGVCALISLSFSKDSNYLAYGISNAGSEWSEVYVLDLKTLKKRNDCLKFIRFDGAVDYDKVIWKDEGFYYSHFPIISDDEMKISETKDCKVFYHKLGDEQEKDKLVFEDLNNPKLTFGLRSSKDERFLYVYPSFGNHLNSLHVYDSLRDKWFCILEEFKFETTVIDVDENKDSNLILMTNIGADRVRIVRVDLYDFHEKSWVDVVEEGESLIEEVCVCGDYYVLNYLENASSKLKFFLKNGTFVSEIKLPCLGSVYGLIYSEDLDEVFFSFTSFTYPNEQYKYNFKSGELSLFSKSEFKISKSKFVTKQCFFRSLDGTEVPLFVTYKDGIKLDGNNPCLMYGYGGFNISLSPYFSIPNYYFMEKGGIFVMVNLRGGGEFGSSWHREGIKENRQNVFDDFMSAGQFLFDKKFTNPDKLAIMGGSNGGLLVGACMVQKPEMFKVAIPVVGVMDMLKYHKFTAGGDWIYDFGTSETKEGFDYLCKYSPYHNISGGKKYPATLIMASDSDDNVVPSHSYKFGAKLQEMNIEDISNEKGIIGEVKNPILLYIEREAGHNYRSTSQTIESASVKLAFLMKYLGM